MLGSPSKRTRRWGTPLPCVKMDIRVRHEQAAGGAEAFLVADADTGGRKLAGVAGTSCTNGGVTPDSPWSGPRPRSERWSRRPTRRARGLAVYAPNAVRTVRIPLPEGTGVDDLRITFAERGGPDAGRTRTRVSKHSSCGGWDGRCSSGLPNR